MRKLALVMMFSVAGVVLSAEEYTIQTISALKESSITPAFEKKVQKSALHSEKKKEGACNVVTVGKYPSLKAAVHDLKKAKAIAKDAFVRPLERVTPKQCEAHAAADKETKKSTGEHTVEKVANAHKPAAPAKKEEIAVTAHEPAKSAESVADVQTAVAAPVASENAVQTHTAVSEEKVQSEPCKAQPCEKVTNPVYVYDRNIMRKSDIHEAIEYYKNSPYYSFKPVITQR